MNLGNFLDEKNKNKFLNSFLILRKENIPEIVRITPMSLFYASCCLKPTRYGGKVNGGENELISATTDAINGRKTGLATFVGFNSRNSFYSLE